MPYGLCNGNVALFYPLIEFVLDQANATLEARLILYNFFLQILKISSQGIGAVAAPRLAVGGSIPSRDSYEEFISLIICIRSLVKPSCRTHCSCQK